MRRALAVLAAALLLVPVGLAQEEQQTRRTIHLTDHDCEAGPDRFCIRPSSVTVHEGEKLVLEIVNRGDVEHNLTAGPAVPEAVAQHVQTEPIAPDDSARVEIPWEALSTAREEMESGNLTLGCGFDGHAALGERLTVTIGDPEERPQPGFTTWAALAAISLGALAWSRRRGT